MSDLKEKPFLEEIEGPASRRLGLGFQVIKNQRWIEKRRK